MLIVTLSPKIIIIRQLRIIKENLGATIKLSPCDLISRQFEQRNQPLMFASIWAGYIIPLGYNLSKTLREHKIFCVHHICISIQVACNWSTCCWPQKVKATTLQYCSIGFEPDHDHDSVQLGCGSVGLEPEQPCMDDIGYTCCNNSVALIPILFSLQPKHPE